MCVCVYVMLCITCGAAADSLYVTYSNNHIQLTECRYCHNTVDKYVEIDNVVLFIDLLLLKPGAYRHLVFNSLEGTLNKYSDWKFSDNDKSFLALTIWNIKNWLMKFDLMNRLWILLLTFEVYLRCISEENKYSFLENNQPDSIDLKSILSTVHKWNSFQQYLYFTAYSLLDIVLFHNLTKYFIIDYYKWGQNTKYADHVISYTILLSYGAKIFPILMIIWPYDTIISMNIIKWVANLYIIEALKIVTKLSYVSILKNFFVVTIIRVSLVRFLMILILTHGNIHQTMDFLVYELTLTIPSAFQTLSLFLF